MLHSNIVVKVFDEMSTQIRAMLTKIIPRGNITWDDIFWTRTSWEAYVAFYWKCLWEVHCTKTNEINTRVFQDFYNLYNPAFSGSAKLILMDDHGVEYPDDLCPLFRMEVHQKNTICCNTAGISTASRWLEIRGGRSLPQLVEVFAYPREVLLQRHRFSLCSWGNYKQSASPTNHMALKCQKYEETFWSFYQAGFIKKVRGTRIYLRGSKLVAEYGHKRAKH